MRIKVNGITLNYTCAGHGAPLILLHGNGENLAIFDKLTKKLSQHYTIYAIDSRNHGHSTVTNDYSYLTMAEDIRQLVNALQLVKPSVVGFSDGAIIALIVALNYNDFFSKMVLLGVNLKPSDFKKEVYDDTQALYEQTQDPLLGLMLKHPQIELESLSRIEIPTLVIAAEHDIFRENLVNDIVEAMPYAQKRIMRGHNHSSYVIDSEVLYDDLVGFLS